MSHVRQEITASTLVYASIYSLSKEGTFTEDERSLVEFYVNELSAGITFQISRRWDYSTCETAPVKPPDRVFRRLGTWSCFDQSSGIFQVALLLPLIDLRAS